MNILKLNRILSFSLTLVILSIAITFTSCEKEKPIDNAQNKFTNEYVSPNFDLDELTLKVSNDENFIKIQEYHSHTAKSLETADDITEIKPMPEGQLRNLSTQLLKNIPELKDLDENSLIEVFTNASNSGIVERSCYPPGSYTCCLNEKTATFNACIGYASLLYQCDIYTYNQYVAHYNDCVDDYNNGIKEC